VSASVCECLRVFCECSASVCECLRVFCECSASVCECLRVSVVCMVSLETTDFQIFTDTLKKDSVLKNLKIALVWRFKKITESNRTF